MQDSEAKDWLDWGRCGIRVIRSGELDTNTPQTQLEFVDEAGPGDFVYVPPYVPHQELNARTDIPVEAVIVRSGQEPIVVNLDIPSPEPVSGKQEPDPFHSGSGKT